MPDTQTPEHHNTNLQNKEYVYFLWIIRLNKGEPLQIPLSTALKFVKREPHSFSVNSLCVIPIGHL